MENSDRIGFNRREIEVWRLANEEIERECWPLDHAILGAVYAGAAPSLLDLSALVAAAVEHPDGGSFTMVARWRWYVMVARRTDACTDAVAKEVC